MRPHAIDGKVTVPTSGSSHLEEETGKKQEQYNYEENVLIQMGYLTQIEKVREGLLGKVKSEFSFQ